MINQTYYKFIESKRHSSNKGNLKAVYIPDVAFDFQQHIIEHAVEKGRLAVFADTGLGKTLIQLSIAENIVRQTNKRVLILTPLAVAYQFLVEAEMIGIDNVEHCKDGKFSKKIVISNYERLNYYKPEDFICCILDESSILKNFNGRLKTHITGFFRKIPYRYLLTATPSPNDYIELGTSSEALGCLGYMEMLSRFFHNTQNDKNVRATHNIGQKFYLKGHGIKDFFEWVNTWSISIKKPSDLGYSDEKYILPKLIEKTYTYKNTINQVDDKGQISLVNTPPTRLGGVRIEQRQTIEGRCEIAIQKAKDKTCVYWTNLNDEADFIDKNDPDAIQIRGAMNIDKKEEILIAFSKGQIKRLITKPRITSFGLNWQHCNTTVLFPTFSYEQYYQAIRRFWRFGQTKEVNVEIVISDGQQKIVDAIQQKSKKATEMYENLIKNTSGNKKDYSYNYNIGKVKLPDFINKVS